MDEHKIRVRQEGRQVILVIDGRGLEMPWQVARQISDALRTKSVAAREFEQAEMVIHDQALLQKIGAPFGVTDNPRIQREAIKLAVQTQRPGQIVSTAAVGTPTITQFPPPSPG